MANDQEQFLEVIDRDEAERRFHAAIRLRPLGEQKIPLGNALGRVLARDVVAGVDVPSFDRSNFDGFAVGAADTFGAAEETPRQLTVLDEVIATAVVPQSQISRGTAIPIATGGMLPRGADAIVMIEYTDIHDQTLIVRRAVTPGFGVSYTGTDIAAGETVLRRGEMLTSRETGVLAAIGTREIFVWHQPRVGIISTGDEIIAPDEPMRPGMVYDSNARIIADAVTELGGLPQELGIVKDDLDCLRQSLLTALKTCDVLILSGGTSKGTGDLSYHVAREFDDPGIVAHGVALKPGKPICLAATQGKPLVILPGFPTSAIFTFHEFVAPVICRLAGRPVEDRDTVSARLAVKVNSEIGRTEYVLVGLVETGEPTSEGQIPWAAYPMGKGSGSVTTFSHADGFITIDRHQEIVETNTAVTVQKLGRGLRAADLVAIGSHCIGLDFLLGKLHELGFATKFLAVGSTGGLEAARRGECDLAGIHLMDPDTGQYNRPFVSPPLRLIEGYRRMQGIVFRRDDARFSDREAQAVIEVVKHDPGCMMVNRNQGSGTRILIDRLLNGTQPNGYWVQARNHNAVVAAVIQNRADWGVAIASVVHRDDLDFLPLTEEQYDFVTPESRTDKPAIRAFLNLLTNAQVKKHLVELGFELGHPGNSIPMPL